MKRLLLVTLLVVGGCRSVKMSLSDKWDPDKKPAYVDYSDYYVLGLVAGGAHEFNLQKICVDQKPYGFQRYLSPEDIVISVLTIGIYTPETLRVWCGD